MMGFGHPRSEVQTSGARSALHLDYWYLIGVFQVLSGVPNLFSVKTVSLFCSPVTRGLLTVATLLLRTPNLISDTFCVSIHF